MFLRLFRETWSGNFLEFGFNHRITITTGTSSCTMKKSFSESGRIMNSFIFEPAKSLGRMGS